MEAGFIALAVIMLVVGVLVGIRIGANRKFRDESRGILSVYQSDPKANPELFLTLTVPAEDVTSRKYVLFDVHVIR